MDMDNAASIWFSFLTVGRKSIFLLAIVVWFIGGKALEPCPRGEGLKVACCPSVGGLFVGRIEHISAIVVASCGFSGPAQGFDECAGSGCIGLIPAFGEPGPAETVPFQGIQMGIS